MNLYDDLLIADQRFRKTYADTLDDLEMLGEPAMYQAMKPNKWSASETLQHVYLSSKFSFERAIQKTAPEKAPITASWLSKLRGFLLVSALKTNIKFKAPPGVDQVASGINLEQHRRQYQEIEKLANRFKDHWQPDIQDRIVFIHPVAGPINIHDFYAFMTEHIAHHQRQIHHFIQHLKK